MKLILSNLLPHFFEDGQVTNSAIWKQVVEFNQGESVHIIAPSGSGKTSLVHFLYGLRSDYHGTITYGQQQLSTFNAEQFATLRQRRVSIVFQDLRLFPALTVTENIGIKKSLAAFEGAATVESMAEQLGIKNKLTQQCSTCSYGEQQRIAIIRALQQPFDFLLLDEPFSHLDEANREKAMTLIASESAKRNACIILADLREIAYFRAERKLHL